MKNSYVFDFFPSPFLSSLHETLQSISRAFFYRILLLAGNYFGRYLISYAYEDARALPKPDFKWTLRNVDLSDQKISRMRKNSPMCGYQVFRNEFWERFTHTHTHSLIMMNVLARPTILAKRYISQESSRRWYISFWNCIRFITQRDRMDRRNLWVLPMRF